MTNKTEGALPLHQFAKFDNYPKIWLTQKTCLFCIEVT